MLVPVPLLVPVPSGCRSFSSRGAFRDPAEANSARTQSSRKTAARLILTHTGNRSPPVRVCVFSSRYLTVAEHRHRDQRNAIASSRSYIQRFAPPAGRAGGGESPLLRSCRLGPQVRPESWREKQPVSNKSIGKSRIKLGIVLATLSRTRTDSGKFRLRARPRRETRLLIPGDVIPTRQGARSYRRYGGRGFKTKASRRKRMTSLQSFQFKFSQFTIKSDMTICHFITQRKIFKDQTSSRVGLMDRFRI